MCCIYIFIQSPVNIPVNCEFMFNSRQDIECKAAVHVTGPRNESSIELGMPFVFESFKLNELDEIYVGGLPANITYIPDSVHENFTGCISNIVWDDQDLQYGTSIDVGLSLIALAVSVFTVYGPFLHDYYVLLTGREC